MHSSDSSNSTLSIWIIGSFTLKSKSRWRCQQILSIKILFPHFVIFITPNRLLSLVISWAHVRHQHPNKYSLVHQQFHLHKFLHILKSDCWSLDRFFFSCSSCKTTFNHYENMHIYNFELRVLITIFHSAPFYSSFSIDFFLFFCTMYIYMLPLLSTNIHWQNWNPMCRSTTIETEKMRVGEVLFSLFFLSFFLVSFFQYLVFKSRWKRVKHSKKSLHSSSPFPSPNKTRNLIKWTSLILDLFLFNDDE